MRDNNLTKGYILKGTDYSYRIESILGQGSFGITYLATTKVKVGGKLGNIETEIKVAVKEFFMKEFSGRREDGSVTEMTDCSLVQNYSRKFRKEAENLAKLSHPGIVNVLEVFEANNTCYYAMQYIAGGSLDDYVKSHGCLPEDEAVECIRQIGEAVQYMHEHKMLHLDLKPGNVIRKENDKKMVLIDFGLSKQYGSDGEPESSTTIGLGTPGYAPLEQSNLHRKKDFAPKLDVYALGATYFKLLTGLTPPNASDVNDNGLPIALLESKGVSKKSIEVLKCSMEPHSSKRLGSVSDFLDMISNDETIINKKDQDYYDGSRGKKKIKLFMPIVGIVLCVILICLFIFRPFGRIGISLSVKNLDLNVDDTLCLTSKIKYHNIDTVNLLFHTTDDKIVRVDRSGNIYGIGPGNAVVTVLADKYSASCAISVSKRLKSISIRDHRENLCVGDKINVSVSYLPSDASLKPLPVWESDNEDVAVVYPDGTLKAISCGIAVISATCGTSIDKCVIKVVEYDCQDLGLSVKWATCNVGALSPEEYGDYFAWGETRPKNDYSWSTLKYCNDNSGDSFSKYNQNQGGTRDSWTRLELADDAARVNWGGSWRMPTLDEIIELKEQCIWQWTTVNGHSGYRVTSKRNGRSIFLPAAGYRNSSSSISVGSNGFYWSSSLYTSYSYGAYYLYFNSSSVDWSHNYRSYGRSVRAVSE